MNSNVIANRKVVPKVPEPKEKTAREKALEFAKNNVPKPKVKARVGDLPEDKEGMKIYGKGNNDEFEMLNELHDAYTDEVDKIKRTMMNF